MNLSFFSRPQIVGSRTLKLALTLTAVLATLAHAEDWPNWRGPNHDDLSTETSLMQDWPAGGPEKAWHVTTGGIGYAGFSIVGNQLFTLGQEDETQFALCLDATSGDTLWKVGLGENFENDWGGGPRGTPTIKGDVGYFLTAQGDLACLKIADGSKVWAVKLTDFGGDVPTWGYAESPLIDEGKVICTPGGSDGMMLALDAASGEKIWQTQPISKAMDDGEPSPPAKAHYSSVLPIEFNGLRQYIQLTEPAVIGVSAADGSLLWQSDWPGRVAVIPSPNLPPDGEIEL